MSATAFPGTLGSLPLVGAALGLADLDADGDADARDRDARTRARAGATAAAAPTGRSRCGCAAACRTATASAPRSRSAPAACARSSRRAPPCRWPRPPRSPSASARARRPTRCASSGSRASCRRRVVEPGASKGRMELVELDRKPSSCPYLYAWNGARFDFVTDFLGGGEMGYQLAPGVYSHAGPGRVRADRPRPPRPARGPLRAARDQRARGGAVPRPPAAAGDRPSRGRAGLPRRGHDGRRRSATGSWRLRDPLTPRAVDDRGPRRHASACAGLDRVFADELPNERIRGYAKPHALTLDLSGLPRDAHAAPAHRLDRLRLLERQRGRAPGGPRPGSAAARGRARRRELGDGGRARSASRSAGRRPSSSTSPASWARAAASGSSRPCASTGTKSRRPRRSTDVALEPAALEPSRARLDERGFSAEASPDGREPWLLRLRARLVALALEDAARPLHASGRRAIAWSPRPTTGSWCRSRATRWR